MEETSETKTCPKCAEQIKAEATRCRFCGFEAQEPDVSKGGWLRKGFGCLGIGIVILLLIGALYPSPKCGEVGYYPKLSAMCRGAAASADGERYCSADELHDIKCAAATYDRNSSLEAEAVHRAFTQRTY